VAASLELAKTLGEEAQLFTLAWSTGEREFSLEPAST
jgi:hypothetical protein